jgi:hypothetical protein
VRFCEFGASGVEVLAISLSLQEGNARLPISLVMSLCSIIVLCC